MVRVRIGSAAAHGCVRLIIVYAGENSALRKPSVDTIWPARDSVEAGL
jgi:hypothetical protein